MGFDWFKVWLFILARVFALLLPYVWGGMIFVWFGSLWVFTGVAQCGRGWMAVIFAEYVYRLLLLCFVCGFGVGLLIYAFVFNVRFCGLDFGCLLCCTVYCGVLLFALLV